MSKDTVDRVRYSGAKPLQTIPYSKKDKVWRENNVDYYINASSFQAVHTNITKDEIGSMADWYDVYNNKIDEKLFSYVTNPLSATNEIYKKFPAKIRAYNVICPTIDLLIGEYSKRPFKFDVVNTDGEGVMNSFLEAKYETFKKNITDRMVQELERAKGEPLTEEEVPNPALVTEDFNSNYKDLRAIKGYKALKIIQNEEKLKEKFKDLFKDWCIAGVVSTSKNVKFSTIQYERLSPIWTSVNKAPNTKNFEDGSDAATKFTITIADLVDLFYDELKEAEIVKLEEDRNSFRYNLYTHFSVNSNKSDESALDKVDLYYCTWKSRKQIGILSYFDPTTNEPLSMEVDEAYPVDKERGESIEWLWVNEVWEGWRVNDIYLGIQPIGVQRNEMNNFSSCKLPINGRRFSDTESKNVSLVTLGMPYQIMFMVLNYRIELTIAKSKGKILLLDKNTVNSTGEGGDEKTFYYAEALGYMLLDRDADGVDRMWNQYTAVDMSLFENIQQLIQIANFYKDGWEELLGITRQRKGNISTSDGLGASQEAIFRSSVISDIIFSGFDEFVESELQGLLDLSKFAWVDGKLGYYRNDDGRMELFSIDPDDYLASQLNAFVELNSNIQPKLELMKQQINALAQRKDVKLTTVADLIYTDSYAELRAKLKKAETVEMEIARQNQESEQAGKAELEQIRKDYLVFQNFLDIQKQEAEWDRKDNNTYIKGEIDGRLAKDPSGMDIDLSSVEAESNKRLDRLHKTSVEREKIASTEKIAVMNDKTKNKEIAASLKNKVSGEK